MGSILLVSLLEETRVRSVWYCEGHLSSVCVCVVVGVGGRAGRSSRELRVEINFGIDA